MTLYKESILKIVIEMKHIIYLYNMKHIKLKLILLEVLKETENFELADLGDMSQKEIDDLNADRKKHDLPPYRKATSAEISLLNKGSRATEKFRNMKYFPAIKLIDGSIVRGTDHEDAIRNAKK